MQSSYGQRVEISESANQGARFQNYARACERSLLLQVVQALLGSLQALEVFHHLLHVVLGVAVLDVGEPAAAHANDDGHHQHEILQVVVSVHCEEDITEASL